MIDQYNWENTTVIEFLFQVIVIVVLYHYLMIFFYWLGKRFKTK